MSESLPLGLSLRELIQRVLGVDKGNGGPPPTVDLSPLSELLVKIEEGAIPVPKTLSELSEQRVLVHLMEAKAALDLGVPLVGGFKADGGTHVFVQDYALYKKVAYLQNVLLIGITIRYKIMFKDIKASAQVHNLPCITASAQLGLLQAAAEFQVIGMSSQAIASAIPVIPTVDVESYSVYANALRTIKDLIWDPDTAITPTPIAVNEP